MGTLDIEKFQKDLNMCACHEEVVVEQFDNFLKIIVYEFQIRHFVVNLNLFNDYESLFMYCRKQIKSVLKEKALTDAVEKLVLNS